MSPTLDLQGGQTIRGSMVEATLLLIEGVERDEIDEEVLTGLMDELERHDIDTVGISILRSDI